MTEPNLSDWLTAYSDGTRSAVLDLLSDLVVKAVAVYELNPDRLGLLLGAAIAEGERRRAELGLTVGRNGGGHD